MIQKFLSFSLFMLLSLAAFAQNATLVGSVRDADNDTPLTDASVVVSGTGKLTASGTDGTYRIENVPIGTYTLVVSSNGYLPQDIRVFVREAGEVRTDVQLRRDQNAGSTPATEIPTITLEEAEAETEGSGEVANLLNASRDVFQQISGYGWGNFRFRERGYDSEHFPLFLNGVSINDPETGNAVYGEIGGLNDVLHNRTSSIGLAPCEFAFTEIGGATTLDTRASVQRKQIRATYAISNRTYTNRAMLTMNTGLMPGGWAVSLSGSRRWGQEGYFDGTFFDGYSYFLSVDKKIGRNHALNLTFLGAPSKRGKLGDSYEEMYDLAGTIRYNPNWGYQNGEKRNAAVGHSNQPIGILRYDWNPQSGTAVTFAVYGQAGKRGDTRLEWNDAGNPAPDYNRRLPSAILDPTLSAQWADALRNDENLRQLDWNRFYDENSRNIYTVTDADGIAGNTVTGKRAQYIVEDQRADSKELGCNAVLNQQLNERSKINAGANYRWYTGQNFKVVDDLLGADYWYDINKYASQDFPGEPTKEDNNALSPHNVVREGEKFGYNYNENIRNGNTWFQITTDLRRLQFFFGGEVGLTQFWRTGKMLNPRFPDNSLGDSEKHSYYTYGAKGGTTFKLNGRNYFYANGYIGTKAAQFRDIYLSPRSRNATAPGTDDPYTVQSVEGGYIHRAPTLRTRLTGYLTSFKGEVESYQQFIQSENEFGTLVRTGVDRQHIGVEAAFEYKPLPSWVFTGATNLGYYHYTSRPLLYETFDNTGDTKGPFKVYQDNFLVPRTPQTAAAIGAKYEGKKFWFASLSLNWTDNFWFQFDPTRRTAEGVLPAEYPLGQGPGTPLWETISNQRGAPAAYTLDFFGGKSWKINDVFIYLNVGVNNILDNKNIRISGRESNLTTFGREPDNALLYSSETQYAPGLNYFISLGVKI